MQYPITLALVCLALSACIEGPVTINVPDLPDLPKGAAGAAAPVPSAMPASTAKPAPTARARAVATVAPAVQPDVTSVESDAGVDTDAGDVLEAVEPAPDLAPTVDAGTVDAGTVDAGSIEGTDAGAVDAGTVEADAGPPPPPPPPPRCALESGQIVICDASLPHWHPDWNLSWTVTFSEVHHGTSVDWTGATYRCDPTTEQVCAKGTQCFLAITGAAIQWGTCQ